MRGMIGGMPWVIKHRSWILAGGLVLLLVALVPRGPVTDLQSVLGQVGFVLVFLATLAILLSIPMALKARREARRPSDSH
jgi:hypothetical protein